MRKREHRIMAAAGDDYGRCRKRNRIARRARLAKIRKENERWTKEK